MHAIVLGENQQYLADTDEFSVYYQKLRENVVFFGREFLTVDGWHAFVDSRVANSR